MFWYVLSAIAIFVFYIAVRIARVRLVRDGVRVPACAEISKRPFPEFARAGTVLDTGTRDNHYAGRLWPNFVTLMAKRYSLQMECP